MQSIDAARMLHEQIGTHHLSVGCSIIDRVFGGKGLHCGITEISGEAGCGKTQLCLQLSLQCALPTNRGGLNGATAYMCCGEGEFPIKRLAQMSRSTRYRITNSADANEFNIEASSSDVDISNRLLRSVHIEQCRNSEEAIDTLVQMLPQTICCRYHPPYCLQPCVCIRWKLFLKCVKNKKFGCWFWTGQL